MLMKSTFVTALSAIVVMFSTISYAGAAGRTSTDEFVNRPYSTGYIGGRDGTNYDREVNGSDASTPGHN